MIKILFLIFLLSLSVIGFSQNLIPNPGFEEFKQCPDGLRQLNYAQDWTAANAGTPELFHGCGFSTKVTPYEGDGMAGAIFLEAGRDGVEYLQVRLMDSLKKGTEYCFECKLLPEGNNSVMMNKIGAIFTDKKLHTPNWIPFIKYPQIKTEEVISDVVNWSELKGSFTAKGGEQYITIGNFYERYFLELEANNSGRSGHSYYYIDEVKLWKKSGNCNSGIPQKIQKDQLKIDESRSHTVYFEIDKYEISLKEKQALLKFIQSIDHENSIHFKIEGHTDSDASDAYNLLLSKRRTETVNDFIQRLQKTDTYLIWQGEKKPVSQNTNLKQKALNRRVIITLMP